VCSSIFASVRRSGFRGNPIWFLFQYLFFIISFSVSYFFATFYYTTIDIPMKANDFPFPLYSHYLPSISFFLISRTRLRLVTNRIPYVLHPIHSHFFCPCCFIKCSQLIYFIITTALHYSALHSALIFPNITRIRFTKYEGVILLSCLFF
jgi:hypothetical protein